MTESSRWTNKQRV